MLSNTDYSKLNIGIVQYFLKHKVTLMESLVKKKLNMYSVMLNGTLSMRNMYSFQGLMAITKEVSDLSLDSDF